MSQLADKIPSRILITAFIAMMVIASVLVLIFRLSGDASYLASIITAVGGAWGGLRAGILLKLYGSTSDQAAAYHLRLDRIQRFFIANSACENRNQGTQGRLKEVVETRENDTQISQEHGNRHMDDLTKKYILTRTLPNALDVEKAKKILLEHIYSISQAQNNIHLFSGSQLADMVGQQHYEFAIPTTTEPGYGDSLEKELTSLRATIAAREALTILQANGVLIPFGPIFSPAGATSNSEEIREVKVPRDHLNSDRYPVPIPAIYLEYRLATPFREDQFYRLASSEVYLAYLVQGKLSSHARRCLQECIDAYRHGLYLSAVMAVGAASESLWMQLARLIVSKKPGVTTKVQEKLRPFAPNISSIITETWQALVSQFMTELGQVFSNEIDRKLFKEQADRLCDRRNYAMHNDEADTEEQTFTYTETGMLLLESIKYINRFTRLIEVITVLP